MVTYLLIVLVIIVLAKLLSQNEWEKQNWAEIKLKQGHF